MNLPDLLTQITPLPWPEDGFDMPLTGTALSSEAELGATDYDYARHAANLFPELVKALEDCQNTIRALTEDYDVTDSYIQARAILARANEIKI